jgi:hypothetical protein
MSTPQFSIKTIDGSLGSFVPTKMGSVDVEANYVARWNPKLDDAPVVCGIVSTGFPATVQSPIGTELSFETGSWLSEHVAVMLARQRATVG